MAFSVRVTAKKGDEELWDVDQLTWWEPYELMRDPRFHKKHLNPGYQDFFANIAPREAMKLEEHFECTLPWMFPRRDDLREKLRNVATDSEVVITVHVYEWESGL